jgi:predicted O-methyltransferase YrrM
MPDGIYHELDQTIILKNKKVTLEDGTLAGSVLKLNEAVKNLKKANMEDRITIIFDDIFNVDIKGKYDLIFIDAAKAQYRRYMEMFKDNLTDNGVFVFDNLCFHGLVDNPALIQSRQTRQLCRKIRDFREWLLNADDYNCDFRKNIGDGVAVVSVKTK